jgi:hypothetical protein
MSSFADAFALHEKDPNVATSLLLGLISEASNGRDISSAVSELVVVRISWIIGSNKDLDSIESLDFSFLTSDSSDDNPSAVGRVWKAECPPIYQETGL